MKRGNVEMFIVSCEVIEAAALGVKGDCYCVPFWLFSPGLFFFLFDEVPNTLIVMMAFAVLFAVHFTPLLVTCY